MSKTKGRGHTPLGTARLTIKSQREAIEVLKQLAAKAHEVIALQEARIAHAAGLLRGTADLLDAKGAHDAAKHLCAEAAALDEAADERRAQVGRSVDGISPGMRAACAELGG